MTSPRITRSLTRQVEATTSTDLTTLTTPWFLAYGGAEVRVLHGIQERVGNYQQIARIRTAAVSPKFPSAWTDASTHLSSNVMQCDDFALGSGDLWVQAGIGSSCTSGVGEAMATLQASCGSLGQIVASGSIQVRPTLNSGEVAYYPFGPLIPLLNVTGLLYAFTVTGVDGVLTFQAAGRIANRPESPSGWADFGSAFTIDTTESPGDNPNQRLSTGNMATSDGGAMFAQCGVKVSTAALATIDVVVAAKW